MTQDPAQDAGSCWQNSWFWETARHPPAPPAPAAVWPRQWRERLIAAYDDKYTAAAIFTAIIMI